MLSFLNGFCHAQVSKKTCLRAACLPRDGAGTAHRQKGVTLIEMAVVIGIIFLLASLMIVEYGNMDDKARRNSSLVSAKALGDAMRMFKQDKRTYTTSLDDLSPYINLTTLKNSFLTVLVDAGASYSYVNISALVKGIVPNYYVLYHVTPSKDPECSATGVTLSPYPCSQQW